MKKEYALHCFVKNKSTSEEWNYLENTFEHLHEAEREQGRQIAEYQTDIAHFGHLILLDAVITEVFYD